MKRKNTEFIHGMKEANAYFSAGNLTEAIQAELTEWETEGKMRRLWNLDTSLWTKSDENEWMGWLTLVLKKSDMDRLAVLAKKMKSSGFQDIVLMGMGGSSLCPAMMAETFGKIQGHPRLRVLDSTDPLQIIHLEKKLNLKKTFFIISSKSGTTLEPNIFKEYFYTRLQEVLNKKDVGEHFVAITDAGTALQTLAKKFNFADVFHGVPSIGGRYSALSNFGVVPSYLMGLDLKTFFSHVDTMRNACVPQGFVKCNPGVVLGVIMGVCANHGKNKVTLIASPGVHALGAWLEQLLAESTGKIGKGLIPIDQEPLGVPAAYSDDRIIVYIRLQNAPNTKQDRAVNALEKSGSVVVRINLPDKMHLGAELYRWEVATAVAGSVIGINPFNQPDVEASKVLTAKLTAKYEKTGHFAQPKAFYLDDGISLFTDKKNEAAIAKNVVGRTNLGAYLKAHLARVEKGDYVDLAAFIEMTDEHTKLLQDIRTLIRDQKKVATCLGFGPRFLHSTGQAYKGGPNTGVFLQFTADHKKDLQVPNHKYSFGFVINAQAQGDFTVMTQRKRRALRIHLGTDIVGSLEKIKQLLRL